MYADPQSFKLDGTAALSFPRTTSAVNAGEFMYSLDAVKANVSVSHQYLKRTRRVARVDVNTMKADVFSPDTNSLFSQSLYIVLDTPKFGITATENLGLIKGLCDWLSASTYANATKFVNGES